MPDGLFEAHLDARDLGRLIEFYRDVVGLELAYVQPEQPVAFLCVGGREHTMLELWSGATSPNVVRSMWSFAGTFMPYSRPLNS